MTKEKHSGGRQLYQSPQLATGVPQVSELRNLASASPTGWDHIWALPEVLLRECWQDGRMDRWMDGQPGEKTKV